MAKITSVTPSHIPETINFGDDASYIDIKIESEIEFYDLDICLNTKYKLFIYAYDIKGTIHVLAMLSDLNENMIQNIPKDIKDNFFGEIIVPVKALEKKVSVESIMTLKLGLIDMEKKYVLKGFEVFVVQESSVGFK